MKFYIFAMVVILSFASVPKSDAQIFSLAKCYLSVETKYIKSLNQVICAEGILASGALKVSTANCQACDKYFHCKYMKKAATTCGSNAKAIALALGDCRAADEHDPEDRVANSYGANGGNCESKYLHICNNSNLCKWNPTTNTCSKNNVYNPSNAICKGLP